MNYRIFVVLFMVLANITSMARPLDPDLQFIDQITLTGSIQFPSAITRIPALRIYYAGNKIKVEPDHATKKAIFSFTAHKYMNVFYLVIAEHIVPHTHEDEKNLVDYLKIKRNTPYKMYRIELTIAANTKQKTWQITPVVVADEGRLPDHAIIVRYNPLLVEGLEAHSNVEFPTIKIRNDVLACLGSEDLLHQHAAELLMSALDIDFIHATIKPDVKKNYEKTIVAMITH